MRPRDAGVVWLGAAILFATILGCVTTIVLAWRHADTPLETGSGNVLKMTLRHSAATPPPAKEHR